jgi:hypothetical protein
MIDRTCSRLWRTGGTAHADLAYNMQGRMPQFLACGRITSGTSISIPAQMKHAGDNSSELEIIASHLSIHAVVSVVIVVNWDENFKLSES